MPDDSTYENVSPGPAILKKCQAVYNLLQEESFTEDITWEDGSVTTERVWEGKIQEVYDYAKIAGPQRQHAIAYMDAMGCWTKIQQGNRSQPTRYVLHFEPTLKTYHKMRDTLGASFKKGKFSASEIESQRVRDLVRRMDDLEATQADAGHIAMLQKQIDDLQNQIDELKETHG